jgi:hypothetical protein
LNESLLSEEKKEKILLRFDNLNDPIVLNLFGHKFWSGLTAQANILAAANAKSVKNQILLEAIKEMEESDNDAVNDDKSTASQKSSSKKSSSQEVTEVSTAELEETYTENVRQNLF